MKPSSIRLYLDDAYLREFEAEVVLSEPGSVVLSQTAFFPPGGGQPSDRGLLSVGNDTFPVKEVREDEEGRIRHLLEKDIAVGTVVRGLIDWPYRFALMRHHGLMHVVNAVARETFDGIITGVQIGTDRSRIDFRLGAFSREDLPRFEAAVNEVLSRGLTVKAETVSEEEFRSRPELVRTLNVLPPVVEGRVRVVAMEGFDAQACGGTHVHSTTEIGRARLAKFDNKGKENKRFYWELDAQKVG